MEDAFDMVSFGDNDAKEGLSAAANADAKVDVKGPSEQGLPIDGGVEVTAAEVVPMGDGQHVRADELDASGPERGARKT